MRMKLSKTVELLAQMKALGIELSAEGDKLRVDAPKGVLSPSIRELLSGRKAEILQFLHDSKHTGACPLIPAAPRDGTAPPEALPRPRPGTPWRAPRRGREPSPALRHVPIRRDGGDPDFPRVIDPLGSS